MLEYMRLALRHLRRDKRSAFINLTGLAVGIACFVLVALYLHSELTYDRHFEHHQRIHRVVAEMTTADLVELSATTSTELAPLLQQDHPEVLDFVRFVPLQQQQILRHGETSFYWDDMLLADPQVFEVFGNRIVAGDPATALEDPLSIAISESMAQRYFGDADPIGEFLATDTAAYRVTLVFAYLPENTHLKYEALLSYERLSAFQPVTNVAEALWNHSAFTYLLMEEGYEPANFAVISERFYNRYMKARGEVLGASRRFMLEPLADIHLGSRAQYDRPSGNRFYVYAFAAIGIFVLGVACINYMNLATARSTRRAREVGMRKVVGAGRGRLAAQFLAESVVFALVALVLALVLVQLVLTFTQIEQLLGKPLSLDLPERPWLLLLLLGLAVVVGLVSGLYPALYLASIRPIAALRGGAPVGVGSGGSLRQALVFLQFTISVGVIACTLLMAGQMRYLYSKPLGFEKENRLLVRLQGADIIEKFDTIRQELSGHPGIRGVALANQVPGYDRGYGQATFVTTLQVENADGVFESHVFNGMNAGNAFFDVMGIELVAGRAFDQQSRWDRHVIVNEAAARRMGWDNPVGRRIHTGGPIKARVIGVVQDFHFESLHDPITPLMITMVRTDYSDMDARSRPVVWSLMVMEVDPGRTADVVEFVRGKWAEIDPRHPFQYTFLDEAWAALYDSEQRQMQLIGIFAVICILISCLGLYGLSDFTTAQRTREIGVRKILGASTAGIVMLLFRNVLGLILVAALVACTAAYYVVGEWLAGFEYRQAINPLVFLLAAALAAGLAFATVAAQSIRTARASPSQALRCE